MVTSAISMDFNALLAAHVVLSLLPQSAELLSPSRVMLTVECYSNSRSASLRRLPMPEQAEFITKHVVKQRGSRLSLLTM